MTRHLHLEICFGADGVTNFYPQEDATPQERETLALRFQHLVTILHEHPEATRCAAGACGGTCGHVALGGLA